jgi:enediyne polyketide synthase
VREGGERARVFALCGGDPGTVAGQLDVIAASAAVLSGAGLDELASQLAAGALRAAGQRAPVRVTLTATTARQLAGQAEHAAGLLRERGPDRTIAGRPDVHMSAGACGAVVVLFPGRAESAAGQPALFATALQALATLDLLGVRPVAGVGYGLAEITGLTWAGCIPAAEAARLVAQCGQVLRACACGPAAMARVRADAEVTRTLSAPGRLYIAAEEGPRTHVLAGAVAGIREMARRAEALGIAVEVLDGGKGSSPMHSPAMARCAAPLRSVFAGTSFAPARRRLFSTVTGRLVTPQDDLARLLAAQVTRPVLFGQAMARAAEAADLIVTAGPDAGLAAMAAECGGVPAVAIPPAAPAGLCAGTDPRTLTQAIAALFAAGALTDLTPFLAASRACASDGTLASQPVAGSVPRMRDGEPGVPPGPDASGAGGGAGARYPARSVL